MTKRHDRYQSAFDGNKPGVDAAAYDLMLVLLLLERYLRQHELLRERIQLANIGSWTLAQLLEIANDARATSIDPALWIYRRLQQNEEAARIAAQATNSPRWITTTTDLFRTLENRALILRGHLTQYRKEIARRAEAAKETGGGEV